MRRSRPSRVKKDALGARPLRGRPPSHPRPRWARASESRGVTGWGRNCGSPRVGTQSTAGPLPPLQWCNHHAVRRLQCGVLSVIRSPPPPKIRAGRPPRDPVTTVYANRTRTSSGTGTAVPVASGLPRDPTALLLLSVTGQAPSLAPAPRSPPRTRSPPRSGEPPLIAGDHWCR